MAARLHVLWDPSRRIDSPPVEVAKQLGLRVGIIDVDENIQEHEIAKIANDVVQVLLNQIRGKDAN